MLDYISALCSEDVWIEAAIGIGMGAVLGLGIKAIAKKLACEVVVFIGVIMSLWSLYQSIDLSINMIKGGVSREQVARYLAVLTATIILTTLIGKVCFTEDTLIKTEDGYKEIKDIEVGDLVYSEDPLTGEKGLKRVTNIFVNETSVLVRIYVGDEEIETTPTHPFWVIGKGWVAAGDIEAGDKVYLYSGEGKEVKEVRFEYLDTPIKVYNFEVEDWHTYFVSEQDVFVHNSCKGKGTRSTQWVDEAGNIKWPPNNGFDGTPTTKTLKPGTIVDRYGGETGKFVSPKGTPYTNRSLPPGSDARPYNVYEVVKPIDVQSGKIAPWFDQPGGGIQYQFPQSIEELIRSGHLRRLP